MEGRGHLLFVLGNDFLHDCPCLLRTTEVDFQDRKLPFSVGGGSENSRPMQDMTRGVEREREQEREGKTPRERDKNRERE